MKNHKNQLDVESFVVKTRCFKLKRVDYARYSHKGSLLLRACLLALTLIPNKIRS